MKKSLFCLKEGCDFAQGLSSIFRRKKLTLVLALLLACCGGNETPELPVTGEVNIIPQPRLVKRIGGEFELTAETMIVWADEASKARADSLSELLNTTYGILLTVSQAEGPANSIVFSHIPQTNERAKNYESYELKVEPKRIEISGSERGLFYGVQSLLQMIPNDTSAGILIPAAVIYDEPRFRYRGIHLDEARHFMGAEFVKKYILLAARYKLNYFHWHLTDDQGWRIEIKKYPGLTGIGSKRRETVKDKNYQPYVGDGKPVEDFYTQADITEIVAFAKANNVTIVPEIEMPGHASAALAAYPEYGCKPNYAYRVKTTWGGFPDVFCPSEQTIGFLEDVLGEVIDLFPDSPYIHIGGDEADLTYWKDAPSAQEIKNREGLKDENDVLRWFVDRIGSYAESRGRKIICWDDMIKTGQNPNAVIMSWNGKDIGSNAARLNREVIMTPDETVYFDRPQADPELEPLSLGKETSLSNVYAFDPLPDEPRPEDVKNIIGGQACVWTEFIKTPKNVEYMVFPRLAAFAERLWSPQSVRDFTNFRKRLFYEFPRLDRYEVNYRLPEPYGLTNRIIAPGERLVVELSSPVPGGKLYFTHDGSEPTANSEPYQKPLIIIGKIDLTVIKAIVVAPSGQPSLAATGRYGKPPPQPSVDIGPIVIPPPAPVLPPKKKSVANATPQSNQK